MLLNKANVLSFIMVREIIQRNQTEVFVLIPFNAYIHLILLLTRSIGDAFIEPFVSWTHVGKQPPKVSLFSRRNVSVSLRNEVNFSSKHSNFLSTDLTEDIVLHNEDSKMDDKKAL